MADERIGMLVAASFLLFGLWAVAGGLYWENVPTVVLGTASALYGLRQYPAGTERETRVAQAAPGDD